MIIETNQKNIIEGKCLAGRPIIAGALLAVGFSFLLNLFSVAIGLTAFTTDSQGVETLALGGLIATALGIVVSMFVSGWVAGYLGNRHCVGGHLGALYGFLVWCVALILMMFFAEYMMRYVVFYTHFISGTLNTLPSAGSVAALSNVGAQTKIVISSYIVFSLFFLSAFACSLGGHCGMRYVEQNKNV